MNSKNETPKTFTAKDCTEKEEFNKQILQCEKSGDKVLQCYTWIYRCESPNEFQIQTPTSNELMNGRKALQGPDSEKRYLLNVTENCPNIIVYYRASPSKLKNCSDVDHFHMLTWHSQHLTCLHSFNILKKLLKTRGSGLYTVSAQKVYNPHRHKTRRRST